MIPEASAGQACAGDLEQRPCPVCRQPRTEAPRCPTCRLVMSLDHPSLLLSNTEIDPNQLVRAAHLLRTTSTSAEVHIDLAVIYANLGWLEEAASQCLAAVRTHPNDLRLQAFSRAIERAGAAGGKLTAVPASKAAPVLDILVVDDSHTVLRAVVMMLSPHGYRVRTAATPFEALGLLNDAAPDLVILDLTLPQMDGFKLAKLIRDHHSTSSVPIVMLTSRDGLIDRVRSRMAGAVAFIRKPFTQAELLEVVRHHGNRS